MSQDAVGIVQKERQTQTQLQTERQTQPPILPPSHPGHQTSQRTLAHLAKKNVALHSSVGSHG